MEVRMLHSGRKMLSKILSLERFWQFKQLCSLAKKNFYGICFFRHGDRIRLCHPSSCFSEFPRCGLDERGYSRAGKQESIVGRCGSARMSESMGEPTEDCCLESVGRKMQVQDDIFRKQVRELHRLYSMQKKLMGELKKDMGMNRLSSPMKSPDANSINCPHKMEETAAASGGAFHLHWLNDDQGSQYRSASSSEEATRVPRGLDLEIIPSMGNDSITGGLSCPNLAAPAKREVNCINDVLDEESDVELTLNIGGRSSRRQLKSCSSRKEHSSTSITSDQGDYCNSNTSNMGGSSRTSGQERRRPHWLFLSVNSTGGPGDAPRLPEFQYLKTL